MLCDHFQTGCRLYPTKYRSQKPHALSNGMHERLDHLLTYLRGCVCMWRSPTTPLNNLILFKQNSEASNS